ncbi:hypothetical protein EUZ85_12050 [Hahella sp. KA22]|uniref:DUF6713 family protein n=1 Tax=Hahella sp. KA22 TaxID=1628392 RepID=UPI000FDD2BC0|nr:DUF6713 family protein [Hahella sp. KA22]AZZ91427.1 hypothetical protein ENC22_09490 [Hahella sp. KA22]QAY54796.1 hypothetical protein EUZ85_12050 [Hahella sp. KA22]
MERSYLTTLCLLIFHQIDAAYWKEWEMFQLPGGVQGYLIFNMLALPALLYGYRQGLLKKRNAPLFSYVCAGLGMLTFLIHAGFFLTGYAQFKLPLSIALIIACLVSGLWQLFQTRLFERHQR